MFACMCSSLSSCGSSSGTVYTYNEIQKKEKCKTCLDDNTVEGCTEFLEKTDCDKYSDSNT